MSTRLTNRTHVVATTYRTGEEPATPPGPPQWCRSSNLVQGKVIRHRQATRREPTRHAQPGKAKAPLGADDDSDDVVPDDGAGDLGDGLDPLGGPAAGGGRAWRGHCRR